MPPILITGGRAFNDRHLLRSTLDSILLPQPLSPDPNTWFAKSHVFLVHGACPTGADKLANDWCVANFCNVRAYPVDPLFDGLWPQAGRNRNLRMFRAARPALVLGFPGGPGTSHMLSVALAAGAHTFSVSALLPLLPIDIAICRKIMHVDD